jgi:hypothetical protein
VVSGLNKGFLWLFFAYWACWHKDLEKSSFKDFSVRS